MTAALRLAALLAVLVLLALPAGAGAQDDPATDGTSAQASGEAAATVAQAGDDQYEDPFSGDSGGGGGGGGSGGGAGGGGGGAGGGPPLSDAPLGTGPDTEAGAPPAGPRELAATGARPLLVLLTGFGLLMTGLGLRLRTAHR